jgi:hypothetical protein
MKNVLGLSVLWWPIDLADFDRDLTRLKRKPRKSSPPAVRESITFYTAVFLFSWSALIRILRSAEFGKYTLRHEVDTVHVFLPYSDTCYNARLNVTKLS